MAYMFAFMAFLLALPTCAVTVDSEQELHDAVSKGGNISIVLGSNIFLSSSVYVTHATLDFDGQGFAIDGQNMSRCFYLTYSTSTFKNLTVMHGYADGSDNTGYNGGGMYVGAGDLTLSSCSIISNAGVEGGGVYVVDAGLTLIDTIVAKNKAAGSGGGIYLYGFATAGFITLFSSVISENTASSSGGGLSSYGAFDIMLRQVEVVKNQASEGGGLHVIVGSLALEDSIVSGNSAIDGSGGGLNVHSSPLVALANSTISANTASADGGGAALAQSIFDVAHCTLADNRAAGAGGGLSLREAIGVVNTSAVLDNAAEAYAGAAFVGDGSDLTMILSTITGNTCGDSEGGGIYMNLTDPAFVGCLISGNFPHDMVTYAPNPKVYSFCPEGTFNPGSGALDCLGCLDAYPSDLLSDPCSKCPSGGASCCGALECETSQPDCQETRLFCPPE